MFQVPESGQITMNIPTELIPKCSDEGLKLTPNLRADDSFVEDEGWHKASAAYSEFLKRNEDRQMLYLELGVGGNTPVIIKDPFGQMTWTNDRAVYALVNFAKARYPVEFAERSICSDEDISKGLSMLLSNTQGIPLSQGKKPL